MLTLYKLEIFAQVVQQGSFSRAAERLLMTQSGVSQHIQDLEASLGAQLFERGRRGVTLTAPGKKLYDYTRQILALVAEAENGVTNVEQLASGQVHIGATPGIGVYLLPEWIETFQRRYTKLTVELQTSITPQIIEDLLTQRLDIGFIEGELDPPEQARLGIHELAAIEQFVIVGKKHPFWSRASVKLAELDQQTFIMRQPSSQTRLWLDEALRRYGVHPHVGAEFDNMESIKRSVIVGNALTILPEYTVRDELSFGVLHLIPLEDRPLMRTLKLIWDKRKFFSPITNSLLVHLRDCFPSLYDLKTG